MPRVGTQPHAARSGPKITGLRPNPWHTEPGFAAEKPIDPTTNIALSPNGLAMSSSLSGTKPSTSSPSAMSFAQIKPGHKAIAAYYADLARYDAQKVVHEGATSSAFQNLLAATGQEKKWALIPQLTLKIGGKTVRPDGTLRDEWHLPRGYWEAKDTDDDLDAEIKKKTGKGYPLSNIIFEDTQTAVLFQNGAEARRAKLAEPGELANLLTDFYRYTTPDYEGFNEAVAAFKERIPDLARALTEKITLAHKKNRKFIAAFDDFMELCRT